MQVFLEGDLLRGMRQLHAGQPTQVRTAPSGSAAVGDAVAQQQRLQSMACVALLANSVLAAPNQIAQGFVGTVWHTHRHQLADPGQARELHRVAPVGLDPLARRSWDRRWCNHVAAPAQRAEVALQREPARAGFVDDVQPVTGADQPPQRLGHRLVATAHRRQMAHFGIARRFGQCDVDTVLVNVQTNVQSGRLTHGPSP